MLFEAVKESNRYVNRQKLLLMDKQSLAIKQFVFQDVKKLVMKDQTIDQFVSYTLSIKFH